MVKTNINKSKKKIVKDAKGHFVKGFVTNPNGRPKGSTNRFSIADLRKSIENVEKKKRKKFMEAWIESSWGDANAMSNIANYMLPKLRSIEGAIGLVESSMSDELAISIQQKLKERFSN